MLDRERDFQVVNDKWVAAAALTHFLAKGLKRVSTEMTLHVLAYNMKRVMKILGNATLIGAVRA